MRLGTRYPLDEPESNVQTLARLPAWMGARDSGRDTLRLRETYGPATVESRQPGHTCAERLGHHTQPNRMAKGQ